MVVYKDERTSEHQSLPSYLCTIFTRVVVHRASLVFRELGPKKIRTETSAAIFFSSGQTDVYYHDIRGNILIVTFVHSLKFRVQFQVFWSREHLKILPLF